MVEALRPKEVEEDLVYKTLEIQGMMCGHCEKMVKKALEKIPQITEATTNWNEGTAVISMTDEVSEAELKTVIEKAGYEYLGIKNEN